MTHHAELIERLRAEADGMTNLSQSAWGIAEPVMLGEKLDFDKALHGFFMAVYEYCDGTASAHRQASTALSALVAERDALAAKCAIQWQVIEAAAALNADRMRETAKLRETLEKINKFCPPPHFDPSAYSAKSRDLQVVGDIARAALAQGGEKP